MTLEEHIVVLRACTLYMMYGDSMVATVLASVVPHFVADVRQRLIRDPAVGVVPDEPQRSSCTSNVLAPMLAQPPFEREAALRCVTHKHHAEANIRTGEKALLYLPVAPTGWGEGEHARVESSLAQCWRPA